MNGIISSFLCSPIYLRIRANNAALVSWTGVQDGFQARWCWKAQEFDSPSGAVFIFLKCSLPLLQYLYLNTIALLKAFQGVCYSHYSITKYSQLLSVSCSFLLMQSDREAVMCTLKQYFLKIEYCESILLSSYFLVIVP